MALPVAASLCKTGDAGADGVKPAAEQSEDDFPNGKSDPSPLQLLLNSLQSEFYEIKKADIIMQKHWKKWMESVERWLQNQVYTQEQLEMILKASVAEYNDKVNSENDRVEVSWFKQPDAKEENGDKIKGTRANALLARFRASRDDHSPLKSVLAEPARRSQGDNADATWGGRLSGAMFDEDDVDDMDQEEDSREHSPIKRDGSSASLHSLQDEGPRVAPTLIINSEVQRESAFEDPFQRHDKNKGDRPSVTKQRKSQGQNFRSWLLINDEQEEVVLRTKAEHISAMPNADQYMGESSADKFIDVEKLRRRAARLLRASTTELFIAIVIMSNSIVVGLEVDWTVNNPQETTLPVGFSVLGYTFNIIFAIEVGLRMFALMSDFFTGSQWGWNLFDFTLVVCSIVEVTIEVIYRTGSENFSSLRIVRMVRITRILRVLRVARVVRLLVALRLLFVQILGTLRSVFWAMVLLVLILYTFGMIFAQVASEHIANQEVDIESETETRTLDIKKYWSTVPRAMFTLYKTVTGGVDWEYVTSALSDIHWFWVALFNCFLSFTVFAVLNVVVGVFCQSAIQSASMDHENAVRLKLNEKLQFTAKIRTLFMDIDASKDGSLTYHELEAHLEDAEVSAYFDSLGIDPSDAWDLFKLLDVDSNQSIDVEEFIEGCMRLRGPAKALDTAKIQYENRIMRKQLFSFMRNTQTCLGILVAGQDSSPAERRKNMTIASTMAEQEGLASASMHPNITQRRGN